MHDAAVPSPLPTEIASPVAFTGVRGDFRRLVVRGAMLELLTLGFYRFWLATDMRRHLWSHTSVGGDAPEYTGTAKELLIGFLFALAILVPIYLVYFFLGFEAERYQAFASVPLILFFYLFYQFAMYRARRYRLTRTIWRGVRFWMKGSGIVYAIRAGLWMLLVIVTLGLALPWYQAALERYKMQNTFYGDLAGRFDETGWALFKRVCWLWLPILPFIIFMIGSLVSVLLLLAKIQPGYEMLSILTFIGTAFRSPVVSGVYGVLLLLWLPFAFAIYKALECRWWISGIRFGDVGFESKLAAGSLIGLYWKVIGWTVLIFILLSAWIGAVIFSAWAMFAGGQTTEEAFAAVVQQVPILIGLAAGYVIAALAFGTVVRLYLRRDVWARVAASALVYNLSAADNVTARGEAANALGEGFADSLDIGGF
jgi:uncharacterized membrane protein YjgN (DUF898 family)